MAPCKNLLFRAYMLSRTKIPLPCSPDCITIDNMAVDTVFYWALYFLLFNKSLHFFLSKAPIIPRIRHSGDPRNYFPDEMWGGQVKCAINIFNLFFCVAYSLEFVFTCIIADYLTLEYCL